MSDLQAYHDKTPYPFDERYNNIYLVECKECGWEGIDDDLEKDYIPSQGIAITTTGWMYVDVCPACGSSDVYPV